MTVKEKGQQLIYDYEMIVPTEYNHHMEIGETDTASAKKCAAKVCDEMISMFKELQNNVAGIEFKVKIQYWSEVKMFILNYK